MNDLYDAFLNSPTEYKILMGVGTLVMVSALRNIWGMLKPVRWTAATALRLTAGVLHRGRHQWQVARQGSPLFDFSTEEAAEQAYNQYGTDPEVRSLSRKQMKQLIKARDIWGFYGHGGIAKEIGRRKMEKEALRLQRKVR